MSLKHILVIEDEPSIADNITYALKLDGFKYTWVVLGQEGIDVVKRGGVDLVILDVGLPDINGFEICKNIRQFSDVPIMFLTARGEEIDRVVGLEIGADDYVVKPFSPRELVARVKVILRRSNHQGVSKAISKEFIIDEEKHQIKYFTTPLELTTYEYGILKVLLNQPERVFSREQLMEQVWSSPQERFDRVIDTHIKTIRSKLRAINNEDNSITTHRGIGYSIKLR